jgi:hypothetical protein
LVKIFGYELRSPFRQLSEASTKAIDAVSSSQGLFHRDKGALYKPEDIHDYYEAYLDKDLVRAPIDDLVESALGQGYYTTVDDEGSKKNKELCDEFGEFFNLDEMFVNIGKNMLIAGYCPVESLIVSKVESSALKIIHPVTVQRVESENLKIIGILQKVKNKEVTLQGKNLAWFNHGVIGNDPLGTSYVRGLIDILNVLDTATENVDAILDRYISPVGVWKRLMGGNIEALKQAVLNRDAGEDIFIGDLTEVETEQHRLVEFLSVDPRVPYWEYIEYLDRRIYAYTRSNNLWYSKDATVASAETLDDIVDRHKRALQRSVKRTVEQYWFKPLVDLNGGGEVPRINFGEEPTGVEDIQVEPFLTAGLTTFDSKGAYLTRAQYYEVLEQLGVTLTIDKALLKAEPVQPVQTEEPVESEEVFEVKRIVKQHSDPHTSSHSS